MTYISWFRDIGLYLEDYLMYKAVTLAGGIREPLLTCSSLSQGDFNLDRLKCMYSMHSEKIYDVLQVCII